jgi:hypothetical protein
MSLLSLVATVKKIATKANLKYLSVLFIMLTDEENVTARKLWEEFEAYFVDSSKARRQALSALVELSNALSRVVESDRPTSKK